MTLKVYQPLFGKSKSNFSLSSFSFPPRLAAETSGD